MLIDWINSMFSVQKFRASFDDTPQYAPNTKISYDKKLIKGLESEHQQLLTLFGKVVEQVQAEKEPEAKKTLAKFKTLLMSHLLKENTSLYVYLKHTADSEADLSLITDMKHEMDVVGRNVVRFLNTNIDASTRLDHVFLEQFQAVGVQLVKRIEREESQLYPTYAPPSIAISA